MIANTIMPNEPDHVSRAIARKRATRRTGTATRLANVEPGAESEEASIMANPRIEPAIEQIDDEIEHNDDACHQEKRRLGYGIVSLGDAVNHQATHTRPGENNLEQDLAAKGKSDHHRAVGENRK